MTKDDDRKIEDSSRTKAIVCDADGKQALENEIVNIVQKIPEWAQYIPQNDAIRVQMTALYHAVYFYSSNKMIDAQFMQSMYEAAGKFDLFSGKWLGWAALPQKDNYSLCDCLREFGKIRFVEKNILLMIERIKASTAEKEATGLEIYNKKLLEKLDMRGSYKMATVPQCLDWLDDEYKSAIGMKKYVRDTLRKDVQAYLKRHDCFNIPIGGSGGTYYYISDLASAFRQKYGYYTENGFQEAFKVFAKDKKELPQGEKRTVL